MADRLFELKRCFIVTKYMIEKSPKMLDLVNLHLSAFDRDGELRKIELDYLKDFMVEEYKKGNYVVVEGNWNNIMLGVRKIDTFSLDFMIATEMPLFKMVTSYSEL
ncbi:MAG: hypothetical protein C0176_05865, partial [Mesoaciditoga sp.]